MLYSKVLILGAVAWASKARALPLAVVTTSVPAGAYDVAYSVTLQATGGIPPYQWCGPPQTPGALCPWGAFSTMAGTLPPGLLLSAGGVLSGIPQASGAYSFLVEVQDAAGSMQTS